MNMIVQVNPKDKKFFPEKKKNDQRLNTVMHFTSFDFHFGS